MVIMKGIYFQSSSEFKHTWNFFSACFCNFQSSSEFKKEAKENKSIVAIFQSSSEFKGLGFIRLCQKKLTFNPLLSLRDWGSLDYVKKSLLSILF